MKDKSPHSANEILRQKVEEILKNKPVIVDTLCLQGETLKLIHELDIQQIELEMQNEELKLAKGLIEIASEKYIDLYDFAPTGYFTFSKNGEILELNFKGAYMLGKERSLLLSSSFAFFLTNESKSIFSSFLERIFESKTKETCEITLSINPDELTYLLLNGTTVGDDKECFVTAVDISKSKAVEKNLREKEEKYRTLFDSNRDSITIFRLNAEGIAANFIEANEATTTLSGYTKNELLDLSLKDIEIISAKKRKVRMESLLSQGRLDFETIIKNKKGNQRNVEIKSLVINYLNEPAVMNIARDITERKQIEINAKKAQESLVSILEAIPDLLFEVGSDSKIYHYQAHRKDLLAAPPEVFMGKRFQDIIPNDAAIICMEAIEEADKNGWSSGKQYSLDLTKGKHWFELAVSPINVSDPKDKHFILLARDVTERKKAEIALEENEKKLRIIFDSVTEAIYVLDETLTFIEVNKGAEKMYQYSKEELIGKSPQTVAAPGLNDLDKVQKIMQKVLKTGKQTQFEFWAARKNGEYFLKEVVLNKGSYFGKEVIIATARDITERKMAEDKLMESESRLQTILSTEPECVKIIDRQGNLKTMNPAGLKMIEANSLEQVIGKPVLDILAPEYRDSYTEMHNRVLNGASIKMEFEIIGFEGGRRWLESSATPLNDNGEVVQLSITRDITDKKRAEEKLKQSEARLIAAQVVAKIGSWETDLTFTDVIWSKENCSIFGLAPEATKLSMEDFLAMIHPEDRTLVETTFAHSIKKNKVNSFEHRIITPNGDLKYVEERWEILRDNQGKPYRALGTCQDITDRKLAEKKLIDNEKFLKQTQIIANLGSYCLDFTTEKWTSTAILDILFGIDADFERTTDGWESILHPEWKKIMHDYLNKEVIGKRKNFNKEYKIIKVDSKEERWVHGMGEITFDKEGKPLQLIGSVQDITERKLIEEKLKVSSEKFQDLVNSTGGIVWEADAQTFDFTYVSQEAERLLGFPEEDWYTEGFWANRLHPDDKEKAIEYCDSYTKLMKSHDFVYRIIAKDGKIIWLRDIVNVIVEEGKPRWLRGIMFDVTSQKENEESLRESKEKYRGLVENSPDAVVIYIDGKIVFINDEGVRMVGAKNKEEIIGKPVLQFVHPDSFERIIRRMKEVVLDKNASATVEELFIDLYGNSINVELKAIPTTYEHQEAVQVIIHDITKRKQSTFELNKINRVYSLISQINNLILRSKNREELLQEICRIAVIYGKFRMSWIGMLDDDGKTVKTAAFYGVEDGYFSKGYEISILEEPQGKGPTGTAMREGKTVTSNNIATDPSMKLWHDRAKERGYRSSISIPIVVLDQIIGSFNLYSEDTNSFSSEEEVELLEKITQNIAFTLESIIFEEDRIKTQEKIKQLSQAVEQSPVTIIITNTKGDIEYVNPKFSETTGYSFDEVIGQNPRILKSGHTSPDEYKLLWQTLTAGDEWHGEFHNVKKDGESYWESASISPILNVQGKTTHYIAIKEDITARKMVEKELIKAKEKAEESDRLKLAFLANMSHEIRTPMNGILGFTELLKEPKLSGKEQQEYIKIIEKSGIRMLNIINDIISISKVESGQVEISLSETNLNNQIEYIHTFFKPEALQKGIQLSLTNKLLSKEAIINTDKEKVYAILTNLVKNAIKFTNSGSIEFGCIKKGKYLEFFVKDSGFGISKSHKEIIFERFRQANETLTRSHEGSGLGLAISKAYVEMLGGKIWVESEEGKGSTFYFTLPTNTALKLEKKIKVEKMSSTEKVENQIKDLKVLIVEDDEISKLLITIAVKTFSKEILKVGTGFEAIEACRNNPDIDLVMMDINMPEMCGYEATEKIREFNKDVVIIAQTANGMQSDRDVAIAAGCTDYISKPVNIASLSELIHKYFKKKVEN